MCITIGLILGLFQAQAKQFGQSRLAEEKERGGINQISQQHVRIVAEIRQAHQRGDLTEIRKVIDAHRKKKEALLKRLRANRSEVFRQENHAGQGYQVSVPRLPAHMADVDRELVAIEQGSPWEDKDVLDRQEWSNRWYAWVAKNKVHWENIRSIRQRKARERGGRFFEMAMRNMPDGPRKNMLLELHRITRDGGERRVREEIKDPSSKIFQLRKHLLHSLENSRRNSQQSPSNLNLNKQNNKK